MPGAYLITDNHALSVRGRRRKTFREQKKNNNEVKNNRIKK